MPDFSAVKFEEDLRYQVVCTPVTIFLHQLVSLLRGVRVINVVEDAGHPKFLRSLLDRSHSCWNAVRAPVSKNDMNRFQIPRVW